MPFTTEVLERISNAVLNYYAQAGAEKFWKSKRGRLILAVHPTGVAKVSDDDLLAIRGVGRRTVARARFYPYPPPAGWSPSDRPLLKGMCPSVGGP